MAIRFVEIHAAATAEELNTEWFILENDGKMPFNTRNCGLSVSTHGHKRRQELGIIDPGFVLAPGTSMRVCTGYPGRKSHGVPPDDGVTTYNLLLNESILRGPGTVLTLTLRSLPVSRGEHDADAPRGVRVRDADAKSAASPSASEAAKPAAKASKPAAAAKASKPAAAAKASKPAAAKTSKPAAKASAKQSD